MNAFAQTSSFSVTSRRFTVRRWIGSQVSRLNIFTLVLLFVLCFAYIIQVNQTVSKGYQIREFESQIQQLTIMNQKLEVETQQAQALTNVARATKMLGLVRADRPEYIRSGVPSYALAK